MIKLKIDGIDVEVEKGKTILEAAQSAGIRIPTLCHDRRLIPFGACRLCVVQEKGKSELLPSCFTPVKEGMEIITSSPEIFASRRLQLQLILLNHPMICPRCEKEGECDLQRYVYEYGVEENLYPWERITFPSDDRSPLIQRDSNKCILCGRCVRICEEIQGVGELSYTKRGIKSLIDTDFHRPLQCEFCGQCLDTCPVGAITSDRFDYTIKAWELEEATTPCPYCGCGCSLTIAAKRGEIKRVFSDPEKGPSDGNLCVRGRFGWDFVDHQERVKRPLKRLNGELKEVSWEEALQSIVKEIEKVKDQYGPETIACLSSSRLTNEEYYLLGKLFRTVIGTNQIDQGCGPVYQALTEGLEKTLGVPGSTNSIQEIRHTDCILVIGIDPGQTHPIVKNEIHLAIRRNRAQLIVLGCQDIDLTRTTQISPLSPPALLLIEKPKMEVPILNFMIKTILKEGLEDKRFIEEKTEGIDELRQRLNASSGEFEGLSEEKRKIIEKAAKTFAQAKKAMILIGLSKNSYLEAKGVSIASSNLALITGHIGKESSGIIVLLEKCNSQGAIDMAILQKEGQKRLLEKVEEGNIKLLYLVGEDPLLFNPRWEKAIEKVPFLIVQDLFLTETAKMAHLFLPVCSFVEKEGSYTNLERRVQKLHPIRSPLYESRSDFDIFSQLITLFEFPLSGHTPEAIFKEISEHHPFYQGIEDGDLCP
ncbi:MAG: molybdopterin-dependent oxidoreductase, partial [Thermodesulfobacteriota bacterium]